MYVYVYNVYAICISMQISYMHGSRCCLNIEVELPIIE